MTDETKRLLRAKTHFEVCHTTAIASIRAVYYLLACTRNEPEIGPTFSDNVGDLDIFGTV